ncbi:MAG TPA: HAD family hydrolase [Jatrophihabitans sp.]|jgi:HAD superfamily hydrolase (TIGR01549 family)
MAADTGILFDVDGTLVDTTYLHAVSWAEALRGAGHEVPMSCVHHAIGMGSDELLDHLLGADRDTDDDEHVTVAHLTLYRQYWGRLTPLPGAKELLGECARRGHRTVLASSASADELAALRQALDADDVIDTATSSSDAEAGKPNPSVLQAALDQSSLSPDRVVFIGDAVWDGIAAEKAGVTFIAVTCGGTSAGDLREAGAVEVYRDPAELLAAIDDSAIGRLGSFGKSRVG